MAEKRPLGISAFLRCRNEEEYIVASILSVYRVFDEIVVILNDSTDGTRELVEDLITDHPKIRLVTYDFACAPAGEGYREAVERDPSRSLARYYNWCLDQTAFSHVCKWDGDMIALPPLEDVRALIVSHDVILIDGHDVLGRPTVNYEPRIFRYDPSHTRYVDWDLYEVLQYEYANAARLEPKCYLHMKLVKKEWIHREWTSPNDLATSAYPAPGRGTVGAPLSERLRRLMRAFRR